MGGVADVERPEVTQAGIDTCSFYLSMAGTAAIAKLDQLPGRPVKYGGKLLGEETTWGEWGHWFGYTAIWRRKTQRLYLHPRLAPEGRLCCIAQFKDKVYDVVARLAAIGLVSYEEPYVTRVDVAADGVFKCARTARNLLHALHAARPPNGGRTEAVGDPVATVYQLTRSGRDKLSRAYDKGRELRERGRRDERARCPQPYEVIRLESIHRYGPGDVHVDGVGAVARENWRSRFVRLVPGQGRTVVVPEDRLRAAIVRRVGDGQMTPAQGERMRLYLELEATGDAARYYGSRQRAERRREARAFGLRVEDAARPEHDFDLGAVIQANDESPAWDARAAA